MQSAVTVYILSAMLPLMALPHTGQNLAVQRGANTLKRSKWKIHMCSRWSFGWCKDRKMQTFHFRGCRI